VKIIGQTLKYRTFCGKYHGVLPPNSNQTTWITNTLENNMVVRLLE
jgi:hypothetical protein